MHDNSFSSGNVNVQQTNKITPDNGKSEFIRQLEEELKNKQLSKADLANLMETSRAAVDRILDPQNPSNLKSLICAAKAVGKDIQIRIV